ncbi:MAG: flippase [Candidatus Magasanikbacteria bacterium]|nr:flippase [Candidatus Magasanikbacteria bacterium]
MSSTRLVAKNSMIQLVGKAISTALGVAVVALVTRALLPSGFGQYTKVITFLSFFGIVADLGLTLITAQMISEHGADESKIVRSIFSFRIISSFVFFALAPIAAIFTPYAPLVKFGIALTAFSFFFVSLYQTLIGVFQKHLVMQYPMIAEIGGRIILFGVTSYAVWSGGGLLWFLGAVVAGNLANFLLVVIFARRFIDFGLFSFDWDRAIIREMWHRSLPIAVSIIFNLIYLKADMLILSFVRPDFEVGLYGAAYRVIDILMMVPVMLMGVILPIATGAWSAGDATRAGRALQKTFDAFMLYAIPVVCGGWLVAPRLMALVAGASFTSAGAPLRILLLAFFAATMSTLFGHFIVALQKQRRVVWVYGTDAVLSLAAYIIFIPLFGMVAAAWATVGSELYAAVMLGTVVLRTTGRKINFTILWRVLISTVLMCGVVFGAMSMHFNIAMDIVIGAIAYCAALFALHTHTFFL